MPHIVFIHNGRRGVSGVAWGDTPRRVGGVIWLLVPRPVPSSRSAARSIFLVSAGGRRRCAVFVSSFSCVIRWRANRFPFVSSPVSLARLVWASRGYSLRFARLSVSSRRFANISAIRFSFRILVSLCGPFLVSFIVSLARLVKQSVFSLFAWAAHLGGSWGESCHLCLVLFCSQIIRSLRLMAMATAARLALALWLCVSFPVAIRHRGAVAIAEMGVPFDDTEGRAVFVSSISSHQGEGNDDIDKAAGEENAMRRLGYMGR